MSIEPVCRDVGAHVFELEALSAEAASPGGGPEVYDVARRAMAIAAVITAAPGIDPADADEDEWSAIDIGDQVVVTGPDFVLAVEPGQSLIMMSGTASWTMSTAAELGGAVRVLVTDDGGTVGDWTISAAGDPTDNRDLDALNDELDMTLDQLWDDAIERDEQLVANAVAGVEDTAGDAGTLAADAEGQPVASDTGGDSGSGPAVVGVIAAGIGGIAAREVARRMRRGNQPPADATEPSPPPAASRATVPAMFCAGCGAPLVANARFCPSCGTAVAATSGAPAADPPAAAPTEPTEPPDASADDTFAPGIDETGGIGAPRTDDEPAEWACTHVVPTGGVPAWNSPDASKPAVLQLAAGVQLQLIRESAGWGEVRGWNGWTGWVDPRLLEPRGGSPPRQPAPAPVSAPIQLPPAAPPPTPAGPTHQAPPGGLRAWTYPDPSQPPAATIDAGVTFKLIEQSNDWAHVECTNGWRAWVDGRRFVPIASSPTTLAGDS
jgi:hypothetical protein